ncbi:acyltransferase family protein [Bradyrhizobium neotropicale]|uniref:Acyltransferase n=1 Tax=Bradyrhizobium neotropicale TaxID=1497615 RepID=A0A176ZGW0_9BRAD|nr:acyltransferase family protein [Bradyrhizobium neotropicale]OAF19818.1 hypothetical protein AXW67_35490 [Bradyrhizobium neotropicale]
MRNTYRPDIDGLRAIAVLAVIAFHAVPNALPGGFIGVDIFFVISGYLISRNILLAVGAEQFSFADFYLRRARRILPALYFTVLATFAVGVALFSPEALRSLAKETTSAVLSISNVEYWRESRQYFAAASEQLGLLHVWSLSAEEQFYLVWPALLLVTQRKLGTHRIPFAVGAIGALSLLTAIITHAIDPSAAFFLPQCRIFEFCLGVAVLFAERRFEPRAADALFVVGSLAVLILLWLLPGAKPLQPAALLVPCGGAALIILSGAQSRLAVALSAWPLRSIGLISYSLYLCHWPTLFFYRQFQSGPMGSIEIAGLFGLMFVIATSMYMWVEQPFRRRRPSNVRFVASCCIVGLSIVGTALMAYKQQGWPARLSPEQLARKQLEQFGMAPCKTVSGDGCLFGATGMARAVEILGDSLVNQYVGALDPILKRLNRAGYAPPSFGCLMLEGLTSSSENKTRDCAGLREGTLDRLASEMTPIIIGQAWTGYAPLGLPDGSLVSTQDEMNGAFETAIERTMARLGGHSRRFLLIGEQVPLACPINGASYERSMLMGKMRPECPETTLAQVRERTASINAMLQRVRDRHLDNVILLRPEDYLCGETCINRENGVSLYYDDEHFSVAGSRFVGRRAEPLILDFIGTTGD